MIKGRDIVIVGQQPWDVEMGSNCKNIALEFSKNNRVLYVNSPLDRFTFLRNSKDEKVKKRINVIRGLEKGLLSVENNIWNLFPNRMIESINWIGSQFIFEFLNKWNNKQFAKCIADAILELGFKDIILFNDNDIFRCFYLKELLKPNISIYYSRDYMLAVDYWKKHGEKLEPLLIAKSDLCVANSTYLSDYCKQYNPNSYYVGQGCDLTIFSDQRKFEIPADILPIKRPIIGYIGALLALRLDLNLLIHIAKSKPEWSIVLVGPEDEQFKKSELHLMSNVFFLGSKHPDLLPDYIHSFDICINPQLISQVTIGNYPRKIDEYLAMGKPVVATKTGFMESIFSSYTYLGVNGDEYIDLINLALLENSDEKQAARKNFANTHTWENSVEAIYDSILKVH
ncbi:MAG: glycosyltransferase [Sphingobacteriia bacterium]|jgi:glycosyltransferase involved in cell wall biosynthesis